jgi:hypothetical protein
VALHAIESTTAGLLGLGHARAGLRRLLKIALARILLERCIFMRHAATLRALPSPRF